MIALDVLLKFLPAGRCWEIAPDSVFLAWMGGVADVLQEFHEAKEKVARNIYSFGQLETWLKGASGEPVPMRPQVVPSLAAMKQIMEKASFLVDFVVLEDSVRVIRYVANPAMYETHLKAGSRVGSSVNDFRDANFEALLAACMPVNMEWCKKVIEYKKGETNAIN